MKAVTIHSYGGPEVMIYEDAPMPIPHADEVLIKIYATSVNPVDWKTREGLLKSVRTYQFPLILGWDVAGTIEAIGSSAKGFQVGDEVYSRPDITKNGSYAEFIAVKASEVAYKPNAIDFLTAASVPLAGLTAWQALFEAGKLKPRQKVLILGASGGVGSFAVQFAKWKRAYVIGVASAKNQKFVSDLGADQVIDYESSSYEDEVFGVDLVIDAVGEQARAAAWKVLKKGGILASITGKPNESLPEAAGKIGLATRVVPSAKHLTEIANLIDKEVIKPVVSNIFPLSEAAKALNLLQEGKNPHGKIVLRVIN